MNAVTRPGDVYCPYCLGAIESIDFQPSSYSKAGEITFNCVRCGPFEHPHEADSEGRFAWSWNTEHPRPNPGCPWCGTCNITSDSVTYRGYGPFHSYWKCYRESCGRNWIGYWTLYRRTTKPDRVRWTIRLRAGDVPFTWIDDTGAPVVHWGPEGTGTLRGTRGYQL